MNSNLWRLCLILFYLLWPCHSAANDVNHKLSEVMAKIQNVQQLLKKNQSKQTDLQHSLRKTELAINHLSKEFEKTSSDLTNNKQQIESLTVNQRALEDSIKKQQLVLLKQVRVTYLLGLNKNKSQFLFETDELEKINRLLTYNYYLSTNTHHLITHLKQDANRLNSYKNTILVHTNHLEKTRENQTQQQQQLDANKHIQEKVLSQLSLKVKSHNDELKELLKNKKNLESVVNQLQKKETYKSDFLTHHTGRFPWPTAGAIIEKFGSYIQHSELKQSGVLIAAPEGQKVYAVAPGKVIFANWLPGYGLLLIVDHGKGYMTLYGNNGVLYKRDHDLVNNHELISTVGHTGGQQRSALYFALRYKGKPIDPATWCQPSPN